MGNIIKGHIINFAQSLQNLNYYKPVITSVVLLKVHTFANHTRNYHNNIIDPGCFLQVINFIILHIIFTDPKPRFYVQKNFH